MRMGPCPWFFAGKIKGRGCREGYAAGETDRASATECAKTRREPRLSHSTICPAHKLAYKAGPTEHRNLASEPAVSGVHDSIVPGLGKVDGIYFGKIDAIEQARGAAVLDTRA